MTTTIATIPWTDDDRTAVRTHADDLHAITAALRSEWIKLTSLRANAAAVRRRRRRWR